MTVLHRLILEAVASGTRSTKGIMRQMQKRTQTPTRFIELGVVLHQMVKVGLLEIRGTVDEVNFEKNSFMLGPDIRAERLSPRGYAFRFTVLADPSKEKRVNVNARQAYRTKS